MVCALVGLAFAAAVAPQAALAGPGLPGASVLEATPSAEPLTTTVTDTVDTVTTTVVPEPASTAATLPATPPVVAETKKTVEQATKAVEQTVAPLVEATAKVVEDPAAVLPEPVAQTVEPVLAHVRATTTPALGAATQVVRRVTSDVSEATRTVETAGGLASAPGDTGRVESAPVAALTTGHAEMSSATGAVATATPEARPTVSGAREFPKPGARRPAALPSSSSAPAAGVFVPSQGENGATPSSHARTPLPEIPSGPLTALLFASASGGGGALALLLAALAATSLLARPGLGRRLRPRLAPWPQPIPHLSLERPG